MAGFTMVDQNDDPAYIAYLEEQIYHLRQALARKEAQIVGLETDLEQAETATARLVMLALATGDPLQTNVDVGDPAEVH